MSSPTGNALQVIEGQYWRDLMDQPRALEASLAWLGESGRWREVRSFITRSPWRRIVLTGMGSSYHGLQPLYLALIGAGANPVLMETSELIHYGLPLCDAQSLIIAVSQSGSSAETVRLLELNRHAPVLGITNTERSPLAVRATLAVLTQAGPEFSVSCKTYVASVQALQWLAALFTGQGESETIERLRPAAELLQHYLQQWPAHTGALAGRLRGMQHLFLAGRGASLAAVGTGALIVKEAAHFHAEGMSSAAFRHGPLEMLQDDMLAVVLSGDEHTRALNHRLAHDLTAQGAHCELLGTDAPGAGFRLPDCEATVRPMLEIAPVQMITLALAALRRREAGRFEHATKITDTE